MKFFAISTCSVALMAIAGSLFAQAEQVVEGRDSNSVPNSRPTNFSERPDLAEQGRHNLNAACSRCHGRDGKGGKGPDLTTGRFRHAKSDDDLMNIMINGIRGRGMPGLGPYDDFWWPIVAYLRTEGEKNKRLPQQVVAGDALQGYELFKKHQCASCHWTGSEGGRRGTDLSMLAATPAYVRQSLIDPNSQIDGEHQLLKLLMDDDQIIEGTRLHENAHFILLMDQQENLLTIRSSDIAQINRPHQSLMPSFKDVLSPKDIEDLATYIFSLSKEQAK